MRISTLIDPGTPLFDHSALSCSTSWLVLGLPALESLGKQCVRRLHPGIPLTNGPQDNPLHISLFPPYTDATIDFSFLLNSCLDIFEIRRKQTSIDQDLGLLHAIDERLAAYGWLTTTGVKLLIIVDLFGQEAMSAGKPAGPAVSGLRDSDLKPVCGKHPSSALPVSETNRTTPRHSEHCKVHTFSSCRIPSIPQTTMRRHPERPQAQPPLANPSPTQSS